jgi:hypothetical protein
MPVRTDRRPLTPVAGSHVSPAAGWSRSDRGGLGPFVTRERCHTPDGRVVERTAPRPATPSVQQSV